ncbi:LOW QUALITY PROTEIN: serine/threonine-protein kinase Nek1 [Brachionichthys hirsutus]|uniref:LOW QUALITY PROTEIN: serine/threonine-protein kinase Nek1 n=1 Tax=Brachionichthys hirsutus TaxID=412623 RepID=UPI0036050E8B
MDKYEKVKKIGEGSFGKAVLVKSKEDGRQYVIKEISISRMSGKERQESRKEVSVLANMSHPNVVQYKESFEEGGCLYIVMDYCEGGDLFKKINSQNGVLFTEEQILDWFVQICLALKHVHGRKILHRDIKSQNIFLTKNGTVQLGDFGIARVLNSTVELARTCIGTPYYLSPEICESKPYNNKSDIWALGCVLYEMCTLKHAFEAGNMKNLVLKIIRGTYPPVSVHYSQELRSLLAQLFKRDPRERPSVSSVLDKPFLTCRIEKFLTPQVIAQEFHHDFLHKQPKVCAVQGPPAKRSAPGSIPFPPPQRITKPACKYGVPLTVRKVSSTAKKPAEKKPAVKLKRAPLPAGPKRRVSQVEEERKKPEDGGRKKRMELIEKELKQREQMLLLKAEQMKRYEKEKVNRRNQAREQGWKHVLSLSGGSSPEKKCYVGGGKRAVPSSVQGPPPKVLSREGSSAGSGSPIGVPPAAGPVLPSNPSVHPESVKRDLRKLLHFSKQGHNINRQHDQVPPGRAYQVEAFLQRKTEAMLNKVRAEGQLVRSVAPALNFRGTRQNLAAIYGGRPGSLRRRRPRANREEEEYLSRLRQIRLQNFNERQQIKARLRGEKYDTDGSDSQESTEEAELRRKALKAQANARAAVLKEQLERKRKEAYEKEKRAWEDHLVAREVKFGMAAGHVAPVAPSSSSDSPLPQPSPSPQDPASKPPALPSSQPQPTPDISMTAALKNVGAITPLKESLPHPETATLIHSEKKQILRRLNQNLKAHGPAEEAESSSSPSAEPCPALQQSQPSTEKRPPSNGERKKWEAAELPVLPVAQKTLEETCTATAENRPSSGGDRKKWESVPLVSVAQQTLEQTCFTTIEQTAGEVIQMGELPEDAPRKVWAVSPASQVLRALQGAELQTLTQHLKNTSICEEDVPCPDKPYQMEAAETTMTSNEGFPCEPAPSAQLQSAEVQKDVVHTTETSHHEASVAGPVEGVPPPSRLTETQDPADMELVALEEAPEQASRPQADVMPAWEQEAQPQMPPEGSTRPADTGPEKPNEFSGLAASEEPLFMKLCSPAHRRTAVLAILSAQSSVDESSSSLASRSRSVSPLRSRHQEALLIDLSAGMFDLNNPKMLRTCSLPDLSRLFSVRRDSVATDASVAPDNNLEVADLDAKDEDQSETEEGYEDEDLQDIRASMERLLKEEGDIMRSLPQAAAGDFNGNPPVGPELFSRLGSGVDQDNNRIAVDDDEEGDDEEEEGEEDEEEEEVSNGSPDDEENSNGQLNEEWHSDGSGEDQGGEAVYRDSIFSRLEELRFNLEQQMGFEKLIEAYSKIKAIHEDEDENIDQGSSLVLSILGTEQQHLYPKILHLVMADGVYQEG